MVRLGTVVGFIYFARGVWWKGKVNEETSERVWEKPSVS
jgi:hypothetical protein